MSRAKNIPTLWAFGLTTELEQHLCGLLGKSYRLASYPAVSVPTLAEYEEDLPVVAMLSPESLRYLQAQPEQQVRHLELLPKVMLLQPGYTKEQLEESVDAGVAEIIRPPYTAKDIAAKIRRAREIESVQDDLLRMSKEIIVEREILARKNDILNFLVNFLTTTSASMHPQEILQIVFKQLQVVFPVRAMQAALWDCNASSDCANMYISLPKGSPNYNVWGTLLEEMITEAMPQQCEHIVVNNLELEGQDKKWRLAGPNDGHIIKLPIVLNNKPLGMLVVLTDMIIGLSRDQAMALNSAMHHLAMTMRNARNYQVMKQHADIDALTGVFNRRHFTLRIEDEVSKCLRYGQALSLIFVDIDHFKRINDTKGHTAGDAVLQQVGAIISQTLRVSDYAARYGGEEFVLLLPHTNLKQAQKLAERLRAKIGSNSFDSLAGNIELTISLGVADLESVAIKDSNTLIQEADNALYRAKRAGRNRTMICPQSSAKVAV